MIKSGGNRVSAKEVEDVIAELREVVEVAVVGGTHELLGEAIYAFIVPLERSRLAPEGVEAHCRKHLPSSKVPQRVFLLSSMPHNSAGKILKQKLREMLTDENILCR
jgi:acyl-CoA synthetase (AMP-forming)/AMP-acid ligase II